MSEFADSVVIVSGGSQNIGLAICKAFMAQGAMAISVDLQAPRETECMPHFVRTDITSESSVTALMKHVANKYGRLDVLVNNAGVAIEAPLTQTSVTDWDRVMAVNVRGTFLMTKHAFSLMREGAGESPAIVNISSIEGLAANPLHAAYAASKGAVASLTHNTALEYGPHGIRCNAIAPGWINTPFNEQFLAQFADRQQVTDEISALHPVGRLGQPADIANTVLWLASRRSAFITGQQIVVDGGRLARLPIPASG